MFSCSSVCTNFHLMIDCLCVEPHLSQLMEDLESISREKELLNAEREKAEKKFALATTVAEKQKVCYFERVINRRHRGNDLD